MMDYNYFMRTIHRDIVGGFIFSKDGKLLLGKTRKGGVYGGLFVVPGGGVEYGETKEIALHREMLEETGIDINQATVKSLYQSKPLYQTSGKHEKTLRDTGERVFVKMDFYDYRIDLDQNAGDVVLRTDDDWYQPRWFDIDELKNINLSEPTRNVLVVIGIIAS
jgi:8-oxo-dGTP pyrophosphatase MutT (NUDIX family)